MSNEPKKCVDACVEFLETVVKGHWVACACEILGLSSIDTTFSLPAHILKGTPDEQLQYVQGIATKVADRLTLVDSAFLEDGSEDGSEEDKKFNYTRVLCHYGSLVIEFRDGWAEADGERMKRCWLLCMPHFKESGRTKYAWEALRLLIQLKTLSPNLSHQIQWNQFVNTRGGLGNNIPCDLYNEHVNKLVKIIIQNMGSNLTEESLQRAVRCVSPLHAIEKNFDAATLVPVVTSAHSTKSDAEDIRLVVTLVLQQNLLKKMAPRHHQSFPNMKLNPLCRKKTKTWIREKVTQFGKHKGRFRQSETDVESAGSDDE